jgi:hypothetical protein
MSGEEKEKRASAVQDAKSVCELLESRKGMLSDDKNELTIARDARELSKTLASIAKALKDGETDLPMLSSLKVRDAVEAIAVADSKAHVWLKATRRSWDEKDATLSATIEGIAPPGPDWKVRRDQRDGLVREARRRQAGEG